MNPHIRYSSFSRRVFIYHIKNMVIQLFSGYMLAQTVELSQLFLALTV